jgi:geranylgeranyl pyrophosphate synthase
MRYAVLAQAGRVRPLLALRTAKMLGSPLPLVISAAASVELLHCASLVVDDLPCMDNASERRGRPATHVRFGQATAVLAAHSLVAVAAKSVIHQTDNDSGRHTAALLRFQMRLLDALDANGLCGGQHFDLERSASSSRITDLKTVPLFRLAMEAGLLGASKQRLPERVRFALRSFAREFGVAYQMTDDWADGDLQIPETVEGQYESALACLKPLGTPMADPLIDLVEALRARFLSTSPIDSGHR